MALGQRRCRRTGAIVTVTISILQGAGSGTIWLVVFTSGTCNRSGPRPLQLDIPRPNRAIVRDFRRPVSGRRSVLVARQRAARFVARNPEPARKTAPVALVSGLSRLTAHNTFDGAPAFGSAIDIARVAAPQSHDRAVRRNLAAHPKIVQTASALSNFADGVCEIQPPQKSRTPSGISQIGTPACPARLNLLSCGSDPKDN